MAIKGMTVHMTEVGQIGANPYIVTEGWSQDVIIKIYTFCKVNELGEPSNDVGVALPAVFLTTVTGSRFVSSTTALGRVPLPAGSFCKCIRIDDPLPVGCATELEAIAVTITPTNNNFANPPTASGTVTNLNGYSPTARSISVTLYLETDDQDGAAFTGS